MLRCDASDQKDPRPAEGVATSVDAGSPPNPMVESYTCDGWLGPVAFAKFDLNCDRTVWVKEICFILVYRAWDVDVAQLCNARSGGLGDLAREMNSRQVYRLLWALKLGIRLG
jgi:hypothetical protein